MEESTGGGLLRDPALELGMDAIDSLRRQLGAIAESQARVEAALARLPRQEDEEHLRGGKTKADQDFCSSLRQWLLQLKFGDLEFRAAGLTRESAEEASGEEKLREEIALRVSELESI
mmetsp:Transcript_55023/g.119954  ORF Transcript_55023/g.119954 Transcript_55023/m.119954 type:complete len:118 (+) Transcript_55023:102-455(+)